MAADLLTFPTTLDRIAEIERRMAAPGLDHLPPDLRSTMSMSKRRPIVQTAVTSRQTPPLICSTLPLTDSHFSYVWESALSLPPNELPAFYEHVARALQFLDPVTDADVANAIRAALDGVLDPGCAIPRTGFNEPTGFLRWRPLSTSRPRSSRRNRVNREQ